jgi:hypothetical protein
VPASLPGQGHHELKAGVDDMVVRGVCDRR